MAAFDYPAAPHARMHGPQGYSRYEQYRAWLRDEFAFRCVYCLSREQWGRVTGEFDLDHFSPQNKSPELKTHYDNLVYACRRCNLTKSAHTAPDPETTLTAGNLRLQVDGTLEAYSDDARALILKLDLNGPAVVSWRLLWIRIVELAAAHDQALFQHVMGYPDDLPNLARLRPPGGNLRPGGVENSHHARAARGTLPPTY